MIRRKQETETLPWQGYRLALLVRDIREVASLGHVGEEGRTLLASACEYIDGLSEVTTRYAYRAERAKDRDRSRKWQRKNARGAL